MDTGRHCQLSVLNARFPVMNVVTDILLSDLKSSWSIHTFFGTVFFTQKLKSINTKAWLPNGGLGHEKPSDSS